MNSRQRGILIQLVTEGRAMTSEELARRMGVSSRTIKTDMVALAPELEQRGARLLSRRNRGYSLEVFDKDTFNTAYTLAFMKAGRFSSGSETDRLLHIARKLVASPEGVLVDRLCEELYLSRGALRVPLQQAVRFCESFHLKTVSSPGQGLRVVGEEHLLRSAMVELFEFHYHEAELGQVDAAYARWIDCDYQERQDVRHAYLKVLRESPYAVRDSVSQRLAKYLIIARNRRRAGFAVALPESWILEIRSTPLYDLAEDIYRTLDREFSDYRMDAQEVAFLAILLLTNLDPNLDRDPAVTAPYLAITVHTTAQAMLNAVKETTGTDLSALPGALPLLEQIILPILAGARYRVDGRQTFDYSYEDSYLWRPLELYYARLLAGELARGIKCRLAPLDLSILACYVTGLLRQVDYPIRPQRLLVADSIGTAFAQIAAEGLRRRWPELIESITPMELYEMRRVDPGNFDSILLGLGNDEMPGYRYSFPAAALFLGREGRDYRRIYNELLVSAYQFDALLPPEGAAQVYPDYLYFGPEQTFQFLAARYARDADAEKVLLKRLREREALISMAQSGHAVVIAERSLCQAEHFDLYQLDKPGMWGNYKIEDLLFLTFPGDDPARLKAAASLLDDLMRHSDHLALFAKSPGEAMTQLLRASVQLA